MEILISSSCYNPGAMILVTGGTGFIGRALVRHLAETGRDVRLLIRPLHNLPGRVGSRLM
jgi:nucleoside-diphosphate-sugar epimerase